MTMTVAKLRGIIVELERNRCRSAELTYAMAGRPLPVVTKLLYEHSALTKARVKLLEQAGVAHRFDEVGHA